MFPLKPGKTNSSRINKPKGQTKEAHTQYVTHGMGNYYGTGYKPSIGKMRSDSVGFRPVNKTKLGSKPKSVV